MLEGYRRIDTGGGAAYLRLDGLEALRDVSVILFDCDGVLIDARSSYNRAIERTVSYFTSDILGVALPEGSVTDEVVEAFRRSGGFNNDWDTAYAILLYIFTNLPEVLVDRFREAYRRLRGGQPADPYERVEMFRELFSGLRGASLDGVKEGLLEVAGRVDSRGLASVEESLFTGGLGEAFEGFRLLVSYRGRVGVSPLITVFEELFLGPNLYYKRYRVKPRFVEEGGRGLIDDEQPLIGIGALQTLTGIFGGSSLGIVSGRSRLSAEYTLKGLLGWFNPAITMFIEDEIVAALEAGLEARAAEIGKPSPYGLLEVEGRTVRDGRILYAGDSKEDIIMAERANRVRDRFITAGVYGCSPSPQRLADLFLKDGACIVTESVNDLASILNRIKEGVLS